MTDSKGPFQGTGVELSFSDDEGETWQELGQVEQALAPGTLQVDSGAFPPGYFVPQGQMNCVLTGKVEMGLDIVCAPKIGAIEQAEADQFYMENRRSWLKRVEASGQSEAMFLIMNSAERFFLYLYEINRQLYIDAGLKCPPLVKGVTINEVD